MKKRNFAETGLPRMYKTIRIIRIIISLAAMIAPAAALAAGYDSVFCKMQIMMALGVGSLIWLLFWLLCTLIYGRIYCSTVCPLGTLMDCVSFLGRRSSGFKGYRHRRDMPMLRYSLTALTVLCIIGGMTLVPSLLDPYTDYARVVEAFVIRPLHLGNPAVRFTAATFATALVTLFLVLVVAGRRGRLLCNTICPVGGALGLVSRASVFHPDINTDKCINCGECERVCKAECIDLLQHTVDNSRCVVCFKCMSVCPNDAITYRTGNHRLTMTLMQPADKQAQVSRTSTTAVHNFINHETVSRPTQSHTCKRN